MNQNYQFLNKQCESCGKYNHLFYNCNQLQYMPNIQKIFYKQNLQVFQERYKVFKRKKQRSQNAFQSQISSGLKIKKMLIEKFQNGQICLDDSSIFLSEQSEEKELQKVNSATIVREKQKSFQNEIVLCEQPSLNKRQKSNSFKREVSKGNKNVDFQHQVILSQYQEEMKPISQIKLSLLQQENIINNQQNHQVAQSKIESVEVNHNQLKIENSLHQSRDESINQEIQSINKNKFSRLQNEFHILPSDIQDQSYDKYINLLFYHFDIFKNYSIYFPHNNLRYVLFEYRKEQLKIIKKKVVKNNKSQITNKTKIKKDKNQSQPTPQFDQSLISKN
ncbi:cyclic nucleotide-binding domain protein, putative (macronuclear) [Tetrahymena thermophila SB210]|uniref:Cyclic nucleotide-binding domain protein, putative n=1 Tax=Tetrahymena thermophila (strain SB210) TaxID=312017 RepID=Q229T1_TETTS|nr:cyclic nucleotide-binding domain protein, putative [Tetrahymena thermophila SB210]EAR82044.4 cyclic nucleotide-binding domain protein, putative [Tetrahymena thermophila SB210]|eukprot:XP_001029707.4 cyclic nucleotide-binding domain protein, putative [Tetrahymena thermophila SB210]